MLAYIKLNPDYIYALMVPKHTMRGQAAVYGYLHIHPWAPQWCIRGSTEKYDDYLIWVSAEELVELWTAGERDADVLGYVGQNSDSGSAIMQSMTRH